MRTCTKCSEEKPQDEFYKNKSKKSGYETSCKTCARARVKKYADDNRDDVREKQRAYHRDNADHVRALASEWRGRNREKLRKRQREWRLQNLDYEREYREENREHLAAWASEYKREYYANNRDEILAKQNKAYKDRTPAQREAAAARQSAYRLANMHVEWESYYRQRALDYGHQPIVKSFTKEELITKYGDACYHCAGPFQELDHHPVPVAHGGPHTLENAKPSCVTCNRSARIRRLSKTDIGETA